MLPEIMTPVQNTGSDDVVKAAMQPAAHLEAAVRKPRETARTAAAATAVERPQPPAKDGQAARERPRDQAEMAFSLTAEERDALVKTVAAARRDESAELSPQEQETLRQTAERIAKAVDETIAKNNDKRQFVEKAVSEWYTKLSNGEAVEPFELIKLLRDAAVGKLDVVAK